MALRRFSRTRLRRGTSVCKSVRSGLYSSCAVFLYLQTNVVDAAINRLDRLRKAGEPPRPLPLMHSYSLVPASGLVCLPCLLLPPAWRSPIVRLAADSVCRAPLTQSVHSD